MDVQLWIRITLPRAGLMWRGGNDNFDLNRSQGVNFVNQTATTTTAGRKGVKNRHHFLPKLMPKFKANFWTV